MIKNIILRDEDKSNEFRTPLIPSDVSILLSNGFSIFVEKSMQRCFSDEQYSKYGATLIDKGMWTNFKRTDSVILGLKYFDINKLDNHTHIYFSHLFKTNSKLLDFFKKTNSSIMDLEYLCDKNGKRLVAFGYYAGYIGGIMGLLHYTNELQMPTKYWDSEPTWKNQQHLNVAVIGYNGRCGSGVLKLLEKYSSYLNIQYYDRLRDKSDLCTYDIIYNCIFLDKYIEPFITKNNVAKINHKLTIVDISCDPNHSYNPLPIYNKPGTWDNYYIKINEYVDVLSIDNLPSLLPIDSSIYFSNILVELLLQLNNDKELIWKRAEDIFYNIVQ